jgi:hypothetical protein
VKAIVYFSEHATMQYCYNTILLQHNNVLGSKCIDGFDFALLMNLSLCVGVSQTRHRSGGIILGNNQENIMVIIIFLEIDETEAGGEWWRRHGVYT